MSTDVEQQSFDYSALDPETRTFVQEKAQSIHTHLNRVDDEAVAVGFDLKEVKSTLAHGQFEEWIHLEFGMTHNTAHRLMRLAENYDPNCAPAHNLGWSIRYELLSAPESVVEMVESGKIPSTRTAIREAKREAKSQQDSIVDDEDGWEDEEDFHPRYDGSTPSYCKYCYETHQDWKLGGDYGHETVWECQKCDHATHDDFMQIEGVELSPQQEAFYAKYTDVDEGLAELVPTNQPAYGQYLEGVNRQEPEPEPIYSPDDLSPTFGLVNGKPFDRPLQDTKPAILSALQSSESNEWFTPAQYVDAAREVMGTIDLDPASNALANEVVKATTYYDISTNGLLYPWNGHVWLNPPYGFTDGKSNQDVWTHRLIDQYKKDITTESILLVNANTEARWFQPLYRVGFICFTDHRIRFYSADGDSSQPTQGNALVYFGKNHNRFIEVFCRFGTIVRRVG